jgi:DNA replication initiation complex subunit (GINS family)
MRELLQELDPDFYREARLHIARVELKQLRRERSAFADIERTAKIPLVKSRSPDAITASNR